MNRRNAALLRRAGSKDPSRNICGVAEAKEFIQARQFHDDPDVFGLAFNVTSGAVPSEVIWELDFGSWRYVSTSPTNNPGKFDLWMDIRYHDRTVTIGNWKAVQ